MSSFLHHLPHAPLPSVSMLAGCFYTCYGDINLYLPVFGFCSFHLNFTGQRSTGRYKVYPGLQTYSSLPPFYNSNSISPRLSGYITPIHTITPCPSSNIRSPKWPSNCFSFHFSGIHFVSLVDRFLDCL